MSSAESPSLRDLVAALCRSFQASTGILHELQQGLQARRTSWISARPSCLGEPAQAMQPLADRLAAEETRRDELLGNLAAQLDQDQAAGVDRHLNVSRLAAALPRPQAAMLRQAADAATAAARLVRAELALGSRLLRFSQQAQEALLGGIAAKAQDVGGYDRAARRVRGPLLGGSNPAGTLIDGRM